jgi:lysophospholipase L1-like esterase
MMRIRKALPVLIAVLLLIGCQNDQHIARATIPDHGATQPVPRTEEWWVARNESFNELARAGGIDLVLLGDSITHAWEGPGKEVWAEYYAPRHAANFGISGDRTQHVLWRIDNGNFDGISPKLIVIMIGTNNSQDNTAGEIADGVTAIVQRLRAKLPKTKILMLAIFHRGHEPTDPRRANNMAANEIFSKIADDRMVYYLDIGDVFMNPDGTISPEIMPDFLHLTPAGYKLWADAMEEKVAELMGEK